jgi:hypothetical protein
MSTHVGKRAVLPSLLVLGLVLAALLATIASGGAAAAPSVTSVPSISGVALQGNTLTGDRGQWSGTAPITYTTLWVRCDEAGKNCSAIAGATGGKYKLTSADVGSTIRFRVTAKNADGSTTADSNETAVVTTASGAPANTKPPVLSGIAEVGVNLHATTGTWVGATPITYSYQWQRCDKEGNACAAISGEKSAEYKIVTDDIDRTLRVKVTAQNGKGKSSAISAQTAVVTGPAGGGGGGGASIPVSDVPAHERLVVDQVVFNPNPVTSRNVPIEIRVRVKDTRGKLVHGAYVFVRSTPVVTSTPSDAPTGADGWVTFHVTPESDFPVKTGYSVQFYVKVYKKGEPTLTGIYGSRLVQVTTHAP